MTSFLKRPASESLCLYILVGLLGAVIISVIILSWVPPVSRDALTHHLTVPKLYVNHGGMYEIPSIKFSYYPMNLDLLYMIPLYFNTDIIPKFIHFSFALLTAILIFNYLKERMHIRYALAGAVFFLSIPVIVKLSITVYVDLGLVFFTFAAVIYMLKWIEKGFKYTYLVISAVWCGLALGTKYNGMIVLFLLALFVPFIYIRSEQGKNRGQGRAIAYSVVFFAVSLLLFSPWMIRNCMWKANPVYPLYQNVFNPASPQKNISPSQPQQTAKKDKKKDSGKFGHFSIRKMIYNETWWQTALIPARIFFQGQDGDPRYFDGRLNPFLFILPFFGFLGFNKNVSTVKTEKKILAAFVILFLTYAFFQTDMRIRYVAPVIPLLVVLSMFGLCKLFDRVSKSSSVLLGKGAVVAVFTVMISMNGLYILDQFRHVDPFSYISGETGRDDYIRKYRPEYSVIQYANRNLAENDVILGVFIGNRQYYSDRRMICSFSLIKKIIKKRSVDSPEKMITRFKKRGITHMIVGYSLFNQWVNAGFNEKEKRMIRAFFDDYSDLLISKDGYGLYALKF